ncbi:HTH-type transcriptional repressor Bm3R1 [Klebsiella pneumoniae]|nr:HTH-type transcriptional repressor Bm3R1 [Klebsiella pneumoniae]
MARPKSEDKKQALLEAATAAFAQSGIAASTSAIARSAGVAEGTLFRYFATKDELLNELYLAIKLRLVRTMIAGLDPDEKRPKENARNIWNSYIDWGVRNPMEHKAIRRIMITMTIRGRALVNLKAEPQKSLLNQQIYRSIEPGYHMNKKHWITVVPGEDISEDLLAELIDDSWHQVVNKLSKKAQQRLRPR